MDFDIMHVELQLFSLKHPWEFEEAIFYSTIFSTWIKATHGRANVHALCIETRDETSLWWQDQISDKIALSKMLKEQRRFQAFAC